MWYECLSNKRLWSIFEEISSIPRESGNEEGIRNYLVSWGKDHGLETTVDSIGNVIMVSPATPGYEKLPSIALQGHMDMVCVKRDGSSHDFKKDPIEIITDKRVIRAKDTSLGGDNGIAIATILDIFSDPEAEHGRLEGVFTISEETGLTGAFNLDTTLIKSRKMVNLDSEEEGVFYIGCAGGIEVIAKKRAKREECNDGLLELTVSGLLGGHSGGEIHKGRANAIEIIGRYLNRLPQYRIAALSGGTRRNVIPSFARATIAVKDMDIALMLLKELERELDNEYQLTDPGIKITAKALSDTMPALSENISKKIGTLMFISPTGVKSMSAAIPGIVETSDNMAIMELADDTVKFIYSVRSSVESAKLDLAYKIQAIGEALGFTVQIEGAYPAWQPNVNSKFTQEVASAYEVITGKKPVITAIHAGLECGIINDRIPGMDSLSIGPNLFDVHSVNEHLEVESAERTADFVKKMLKMIKE